MSDSFAQNWNELNVFQDLSCFYLEHYVFQGLSCFYLEQDLLFYMLSASTVPVQLVQISLTPQLKQISVSNSRWTVHSIKMVLFVFFNKMTIWNDSQVKHWVVRSWKDEIFVWAITITTFDMRQATVHSCFPLVHLNGTCKTWVLL